MNQYEDGYNQPCSKFYYYFYWGWYTFYVSAGTGLILKEVIKRLANG